MRAEFHVESACYIFANYDNQITLEVINCILIKLAKDVL